MSSPMVSYIMEKTLNRKVVNSLAALLLLLSLPWVFHNGCRPLLFSIERKIDDRMMFSPKNILNTPRIDQYFINNPQLKDHYMGAADFIKSRGCNRVGMHLHEDDWEYPFWVLLRQKNDSYIRIEHVLVSNISSSLINVERFKGFVPCAVISLVTGNANKVVIYGYTYHKAWSSGPVSVMMK